MVDMQFFDSKLERIYQKLAEGKRLDLNDGLALYESPDFFGVGKLADSVRRSLHGGKAYYVYNQHINYTNVCVSGCLFCGFSRKKAAEGAFTLTIEAVERQLTERLQEPVREIHIVGGLNPELPFSYYLDLITTAKSIRPEAAVKAFTAVEIDFLSRLFDLKIEEVLSYLQAAGLEMMPGGGAEVLSERVRQQLYPRKISPGRWLEVMEIVHTSGIPTNATMLYGHIETIEERVRHLIQLRELQDRTQGFSAFVPLTFHSSKTRLSHIPSTVGVDDLRTIAVSRLMLDNIPHIKAYWIMLTPALAQVALSFGADDFDGTVIEEKITHMAGAGTPVGLGSEEIQRLIRSAGFSPVERDAFYNPLEE